MEPLIQNDAVLFGILIAILAFVFWSSHSDRPGFKKFYKYVPALLLCYFLPSLLTAIPDGLSRLFGEGTVPPLINAEESKLYFVASRYLLPASLVLLTLNLDIKGILGLGPKAVIMFGVSTLSIIIGAPVALWIVSFINPFHTVLIVSS